MYDLVAGPKPADVVATPVPDENLQDTRVPGIVTGTPTLTDYGTYAVNNIVIQPDDSGNTNVVGATEIALGLYYVDELATDLWASIDSAVDAATDPATVNCTVNRDTARAFKVGDFIVFNDEAQRAYPGVPAGQATFGTHWNEPVATTSPVLPGPTICAHSYGATWEQLEYMGVAQSLPTAYKTTFDFLVQNEGYGLPATRRLPYADFG